MRSSSPRSRLLRKACTLLDKALVRHVARESAMWLAAWLSPYSEWRTLRPMDSRVASKLLAIASPVASEFTSLSAVLKETSCCLALLQSTRHACT